VFGIFRRGGKLRLTRAESLEARPVRNPLVKYELTDDGAALEVPITVRKGAGILLRIMSFGAKASVPEAKRIELDGIGAFVWELCDGTRSVKEIARRLAQRESISRREAEHSLVEFLKTLVRRRLVLLGIPSEGGPAGAGKDEARA
jgi:hypothetical protein